MSKRYPSAAADLGRRQTLEIFPTLDALLDRRVGRKVAEQTQEIFASFDGPIEDRLQCFTCGEFWTKERYPEFVMLILSLDRPPAALMGFVCCDCRAKGELVAAVRKVLRDHLDFKGTIEELPTPGHA